MTSNNITQVTETFDIADLPMIVLALMTMHVEQRMCGHKLAADRMRTIVERLKPMMPEAAKLFDDGVWCELCVALNGAEGFEVVHPMERGYPTGDLIVRIGGKSFRADGFNHRPGDDAHRLIEETLNRMLPMKG